MVKLSPTKLVVAFGGLALSLTTGLGVASAQPDLSPLINTTCSYAQVEAALNVQNPQLAKMFYGNPIVQSWLQTFLGSPPDQRQQMLQQSHFTQQYAGQVVPIANVCNNY